MKKTKNKTVFINIFLLYQLMCISQCSAQEKRDDYLPYNKSVYKVYLKRVEICLNDSLSDVNLINILSAIDWLYLQSNIDADYYVSNQELKPKDVKTLYNNYKIWYEEKHNLSYDSKINNEDVQNFIIYHLNRIKAFLGRYQRFLDSSYSKIILTEKDTVGLHNKLLNNYCYGESHIAHSIILCSKISNIQHCKINHNFGGTGYVHFDEAVNDYKKWNNWFETNKNNLIWNDTLGIILK